MNLRRRRLLIAAAALGAISRARAAETSRVTLDEAIRAHTGGKSVRPGRVKIEMDTLVENGNAVPIALSVESPMTEADHVTSLAMFNERNPQREVIKLTLGPRNGRAAVSTRIRLSTSQKLTAIARMNDGSYWSASVDVIVTLAGCVET